MLDVICTALVGGLLSMSGLMKAVSFHHFMSAVHGYDLLKNAVWVKLISLGIMSAELFIGVLLPMGFLLP